MIVGIDIPRDLHLAQIAQTLHAFGPVFRAGQNRQEQSGKDADDANHDQQFNKSKTHQLASGQSVKCGRLLRVK